MTRITQLYPRLELLSEGEPPHHTLFVMARLPGSPDRLLLIDPPADVTERFSLADENAVLYTGPARESALPELQTQPGGIAHLSIGEHLLDIYSQQTGNVIYFPTLGVLCGGDFGSDLALPRLAPGSDGSEEIETLRLLAQTVKQRRLEVYIPRIGSLCRDRVEVMGRLAGDVSYLHGLRRIIPAGAEQGEALERIEQMAAGLVPENRRTAFCREIHEENVERLWRAVQA
ncbi:MAG: hypothetical protein KJZ86_22310 [Caldilineaceae bacterium]|nr:hypothetical protein [Caldilineaceae bacterium]